MRLLVLISSTLGRQHGFLSRLRSVNGVKCESIPAIKRWYGVHHTNGGVGENSYAGNSAFPRKVISKAMPHVKEALTELYRKTLPQCLRIADLGCSCGPNTLFVISELINTVNILRQSLGGQLPEFQVFLNDLPGNDFNTIFRSTPCFYEQLCKDMGGNFPRCYITGVPGSFYGRLFPTNTLMFVHSSYSLHWLSQVPEGIGSNKGNIYIGKTSPSRVFEAYKKQFEKDFSVFLRSRSEEIISGGRMVITIPGRRSPDPSSNGWCRLCEILSESLLEMVEQGFTEESKIDSCNMPLYAPSGMELNNIIQSECSFELDSLEAFDVNWDPSDEPENKEFVFDNKTTARCIAKNNRAVMESMLSSHFGTEIIDDLFQTYTEKFGEHLEKEQIEFPSLVMRMTRK